MLAGSSSTFHLPFPFYSTDLFSAAALFLSHVYTIYLCISRESTTNFRRLYVDTKTSSNTMPQVFGCCHMDLCHSFYTQQKPTHLPPSFQHRDREKDFFSIRSFALVRLYICAELLSSVIIRLQSNDDN